MRERPPGITFAFGEDTVEPFVNYGPSLTGGHMRLKSE